jgi:type II secretory pathway component PulL
MKFHIFTRENLWAVVICLILVILVILTASSAPIWIYQGF